MASKRVTRTGLPASRPPLSDFARLNISSGLSEGSDDSEDPGFVEPDIKERIGPDGRYTILRKLGQGLSATIWLAWDSGARENTFVGVKILNQYHSNLAQKDRLMYELNALQVVSRPPRHPHCIHLLDTFTYQKPTQVSQMSVSQTALVASGRPDAHSGPESEVDHLCFVTPLMGGSVRSILRQYISLPPRVARLIGLHVLKGIAHAHSRGVVHTDIKADNVLFSKHLSDMDIRRLVESDERQHQLGGSGKSDKESGSDSEGDSDGSNLRSPMPLPMPKTQDIGRLTFVLADFGSAQQNGKMNPKEVCPVQLRPPEIYLDMDWDEKVDIWMFGCLMFELIAGRHLFNWCRNEQYDMDELFHMLFQMVMLHGGKMPIEVLKASRNAGKFFERNQTVKGAPEGLNVTLQFLLWENERVPNNETIETARFLYRCLALDPQLRPSARDLLNDPWFGDVHDE